MTIPHVIEHLTATAESRGKVFGPQDSSALLALHTIEQNLNLADGDNCTLFELREAIDFKHPPED